MKSLWHTRRKGERLTILVWATFEEMERMYNKDIIEDYTNVVFFTPKDLREEIKKS